MRAMRTTSLALLLSVLVLPAAEAAPVRKPVAYTLDGASYEGVLLFDDAVKGTRPGLLLVPNWLGINEENLAQAAEIAGRRYVVFVADVYGKETRPASQPEAGKAAGALKANRAELRKRTAKALEVFRGLGKQAAVDAGKVGAIGFCFGGTAVLELAKAGADVGGVISFHGGLDAPSPTGTKPKARILALHGADDPTVSAADLQAFKEDLRKAKADWTLVEFGGAVHSFTDRKANTPGRSMYDPKVAARSYEMMGNFFSETFRRR